MTERWEAGGLIATHGGGPISSSGGLHRYVVFGAILNPIWEVAQLPLYSIWRNGSWRDIALAVLHCTAGDVMMTTASLLGSLLALGRPDWPTERYLATAISTVIAGLAYTMFSEWFNIEIRHNWADDDLMRTLPWTGTGLSPLAQWIVIPVVNFLWLGRAAKRPQQLRET